MRRMRLGLRSFGYAGFARNTDLAQPAAIPGEPELIFRVRSRYAVGVPVAKPLVVPFGA